MAEAGDAAFGAPNRAMTSSARPEPSIDRVEADQPPYFFTNSCITHDQALSKYL